MNFAWLLIFNRLASVVLSKQKNKWRCPALSLCILFPPALIFGSNLVAKAIGATLIQKKEPNWFLLTLTLIRIRIKPLFDKQRERLNVIKESVYRAF